MAKSKAGQHVSGGCAPDNHDFTQIVAETLIAMSGRPKDEIPRFICRKCGKVIEA
jgi:hypothetical protein